MKKIRVLMLGWEYPPYWVGGLGIHCYYLTRALAKLGVHVYFVTPNPIHKKMRNLEIEGFNINPRLKKKEKKISYSSFKKEKTKIFKKSLNIIKDHDFDIIHCQDIHPINISILLKKISKRPFVITIHSTVYDRRKKPTIEMIKKEREGMLFADKVIAVSNFTKDIIINKYKIKRKNVVVIYNAVKHKKISGIKKIGKTKYILVLGRLTYQKGIPYFIDAAAKVLKKDKNIKFLIAGEGNAYYTKRLKKKVNKLAIKKNISFLGFVKNKDYYYRKAHLLVMPSISEPFGIVPLEALINGTPVIISRQSGVSEVLKSCPKFNYWNTDDLAKKILFLVRDNEAYNKLRKECIKEVKNFTWDSVAKKTLDLYKKVLNKR